MSNIIYVSRFSNNSSGNGGDRRTAQICQSLKNVDYKFVSIFDIELGKWHKMINMPSGLIQETVARFYKKRITSNTYNMWSSIVRDHIAYMHMISNMIVDSMKHTTVNLLLVDDPVFLSPLVYYAKAKGIPIIALCHNIETLSSEQVIPTTQRDMFMYELKLLSMCNLVITISKEETFLLKNLGLSPVYFPYFPSQEIYERFEKVRSRRLSKPKADYLLLGTVYNPPTLDGMKHAISVISCNNILNNDRIIIAGYGTRERLGDFTNANVELRGDVTDQELDEILSVVKGCIVYQNNGSGALTKISELLTAGVPVIINSHAARSHYNLPGIFEFDDLAQLIEQMKAASKVTDFAQVLSPPDVSILHKRIAELLR